ncbi:MAG: c-type cytochrome [Nevskia sp.]|nr:c-type cytochrome [Nevskia sp.]
MTLRPRRLRAALAGALWLAWPAAHPAADESAAIGRLLFFDPSLSASGRLSCAGCHNPKRAFAPDNALAVQRGGADGRRAGLRAVPSLAYVLPRTPAWHQPRASSQSERLLENDSEPAGGFGWDGRFDTLRAQAAFPLFDPAEMANANIDDFAARLRRAPYAGRLRALCGAAFEDAAALGACALAALEQFELQDPAFHPFSSKYDRVLDGKAAFTAQEARGKRLFDDPRRGNCASCHDDTPGADGSHPLFTDFRFAALGVPRNPEIPANADAAYFDLGLCGPLRHDRTGDRPSCGLFKTPGLRNVATRRAFFHNGRFHTLREALRFYSERDGRPAKWYPRAADGTLDLFDDLPRDLRGNVDRSDEPLTRKAGDPPVFSEAELDDLEAFLNTLTDGYQGTAP